MDKKPDNDVKSLNIRMSREIWRALKKMAIDQETTMNAIINDCLRKKIKKEAEKS